MLALDYEDAKKLAIALIVGFVLLSLVAAIVIKNITMKLISALVMIGLALGVWTQRQSLQDCKDRLEAKVSVGDLSDTTCPFFGREITIPGFDDN